MNENVFTTVGPILAWFWIALLLFTGVTYRRRKLPNKLHEAVYQLLLGDEGRIDIPNLMLSRAPEILFAGIAAAFVVLISFIALILPSDLRALVWLGCAFILVSVFDRPKWNGFVLIIPLTFTTAITSSVVLGLIVSGMPKELVVVSAFGVFVGSIFPIAFGLLCAAYLALQFGNLLFESLTGKFRPTKSAKGTPSDQQHALPDVPAPV